MAKLDTVTLTGQSGQTYTFRVYVWEHRFKPLAGVYVVTERTLEPNGSPSYSPVYVEQTDDVSRLFETHPKSRCFEFYYANTIGVLAEPNEAERIRIRDELISALHPPCNEQDPTGSTKAIETPADGERS